MQRVRTALRKLGGFALKQRRLLAIGIIAAAVLIGVGSFGWQKFQEYRESKKPSVQIGTEEQFYSNELKKLKSDPPSAQDPVKQTDYYDQLAKAEYSNGNPKAAIEAFRKREALNTAGLDYHSYQRLAEYYLAAKDRQGAIQALDKVKSLLPKTSEKQSEEYSYQDMLESTSEYQDYIRTNNEDFTFNEE